MTGRRIGYLNNVGGGSRPSPGRQKVSSRHHCPKFCNQPCPRNQRAQGRPGARRTRGLVRGRYNKDLRTSIQVWRKHTAFPAQWLYGLYVIVLVTLLFVTPSLS